MLVCQARAAADGRLAIGRFRDPVALEMLHPTERRVVELARGERKPNLRERVPLELLQATVDIVVTRTVAIDDAVVDAGHRQLVILGAGLDGRAWRMPELVDTHVFEVDQPASQEDKRSRTVELTPTAAIVSFVPVQLGPDSLLTALTEAAHVKDTPTTWIWEGVLPYLSHAQVRSTLGDLAAASAPGSRLIASYPTRSRVNPVAHYGLKAAFTAARQPNPLATERHVSSWSTTQMRDLLVDHGLTVVSDTGQRELAWQLGFDAHRPRQLEHGRIVVAERR